MPDQATTQTPSRLLAVVIREVLQAERFDSLADLVVALKARCARLRIPWTPDDITAALDLVSSNTELVSKHPPPPPPPEPPPPIGREEAAGILTDLGITSPLRPMPKARLVTQQQADKLKALSMVLDEIKAAEARCDALENEPPA